jgi:hypothetical protein
MTVDTTRLRRELADQQEVLAFWFDQKARRSGVYTHTIATVEQHIAELQAQLTELEGEQ